MEEKTSRIVEVILSSVKPFELMMGKIIGVALVGLTQFLLWLVLTVSLYTIANVTLLKSFNENISKTMQQKEEAVKASADLDYVTLQKTKQPNKIFELYEGLQSINFKQLTLLFIFYFLGGYLLYSALFAAIGAAVDNEADTQQFMLPITIPLVFSFVIAQVIIQDPESSLSFWFSIIPLTSPIIMMVRLPFGVPMWEVALSMSLLIIGFIVTTWIAARIYRTGILMYGKKITYKELWKWLFYKG